MEKLHLLCNAHLDPAWLWRWNEGLAEAISTFRVAADFCEQYDGFIFNHKSLSCSFLNHQIISYPVVVKFFGLKTLLYS